VTLALGQPAAPYALVNAGLLMVEAMLDLLGARGGGTGYGAFIRRRSPEHGMR